jgi:processive 1,2-diacylglycerol beta-glucosyltransferase
VSGDRPRVLVLSIALGSGHAAVAGAVRDLLHEQAPGRYDVTVADLSQHLRYAGRPLAVPISRFYDWSVRAMRAWPYRTLYRLADARPSLLATTAQLLFGRQAGRWLRGQRPDIVVSTYPLVTCVAGRTFRGTDVNVLSVITDIGEVTRLWWAGGPDTAMSLVMHPAVADHAVMCGVPPDRVIDVGLLTTAPAGSFRTPGRAAGPLRVLLTAGGLGYGPNLLEVAGRLATSPRAARLQYAIAVGSNDDLRDQLQLLLGPGNTTVWPRTGMAARLHEVDLVVGKAGWATLSECIATQTPMLITDRIPGQEEHNADLADQLSLARICDVDAAVQAIELYATDPAALCADFADGSLLRHGDAGARVARVIRDALTQSDEPLGAERDAS